MSPLHFHFPIFFYDHLILSLLFPSATDSYSILTNPKVSGAADIMVLLGEGEREDVWAGQKEWKGREGLLEDHRCSF